MTDHRKRSLYFPADLLEWVQKEAERLDRSHSWVVQQALDYARKEIEKLPAQQVGKR